MAHRGKTVTWREAIDWALRKYREDLDKLREYDLRAKRPARA